MIPAKFDYRPAASADEALALLAEYGDEAKLLAGGHSLLPLMKLRLARPEVLIDIGEVTDLSYVNDGGDYIAVGALTKHREVERSELLQAEVPVLAHTAGHVGDPQVRNRGTIGGSLVHGDPASDLPSVALAAGATMVMRGSGGERTLAAADFFTDFLETAIGADELLTEIRFPKMNGAGWSFQKFNRRAQDWAIVGCTVVGGDNPGVAMVNMGSKPEISAEATAALASGSSGDEVGELAAQNSNPPEDLSGDAEYRRHLARVLVAQAVGEATS